MTETELSRLSGAQSADPAHRSEASVIFCGGNPSGSHWSWTFC